MKTTLFSGRKKCNITAKKQKSELNLSSKHWQQTNKQTDRRQTRRQTRRQKAAKNSANTANLDFEWVSKVKCVSLLAIPKFAMCVGSGEGERDLIYKYLPGTANAGDNRITAMSTVLLGDILNAQQTSLILHSPGKRSNKLSGTFSLHPFSPPLSVSLTIRRTSEWVRTRDNCIKFACTTVRMRNV